MMWRKSNKVGYYTSLQRMKFKTWDDGKHLAKVCTELNQLICGLNKNVNLQLKSEKGEKVLHIGDITSFHRNK